MLTLTNDAASAIRGLTAGPEISDDAGLRIASTSESGVAELAVSLVAQPGPDDQTVEREGARLYLDPQVAPLLEDQMLDADVTEQGQVRFELTSKAGP